MGTEGPTAVLEPLWRGLPAPGTETLSGSATCALPPRRAAVRSARDFTHRTLRRWDVPRDLDEVALVVSELVTNALRHGLPAGTAGSEADCADGGAAPEGADAGADGAPVRLQLMRWSARLVCAVRDPGEAAPRRGGAPRVLGEPAESAALETPPDCPGLSAESGRGLYLVDSFSDCWGWHRLTGARTGKVVWAMFRFTPRT